MRYFIIKYVQKPGHRGEKSRMDEVMTVAKRIKNRDWQSANVILDFQDQRVLLAHMDGVTIPRDWDRIVSYYYKHYANVIENLFEQNGHPINTETQPTDVVPNP